MKKKRTAADALVDIIHQQGVEYIFGLPGGKAIPIFDALVNSPIKLVLTRHEQGATHMADGYARSTGKTGVALVTSGPGATNTITGLFTAQMDSVPIVVICGQQNTGNLGLDTFQEADVSGITYSIVKHSYLVKDPKDIPRIVKEAFHIANTGRPGPVLIDIPGNVSSAVIDDNILVEQFDLPGYKIQEELDLVAIEKAAELISISERPILLVGHGAVISRAEKSIAYIIEKLKIPVVNTLLGKGAFPEDHELNLGMPGMHGTAYGNKALNDCDLIINIGSRWDDRIVSNLEKFCPHAKLIHIDIDPVEINKTLQIDIPIIGDARLVLEAMTPFLREGNTERWIKQVKRWRCDFPLKYKKEGKLRAQHVISEFYKASKGNAIAVTDVGQHQMWVAQYFLVKEPNHWVSSGGAGTMGFGLPAAIGAQLGNPDKKVISFSGDGGFQMTLCELATAANFKLPIKIVILNNRYLGMVRQWQYMFYENRLSGVDLEGNPDFVKLAQSYGIKGFRLKRTADVKKVVNAAMAYNDGPCVIEAFIEQHDNVFPMVPAGAALDEMILDEPKNFLASNEGR